MCNLLTSSVSHELITPIRCIIAFGQQLVSQLKMEGGVKKASMIVCTAKLLETQIKLLLDNSLMENN